jgi:predicted nuclease of predicted toxin-antitoxin system
MRFLLDEHISRVVLKYLRRLGHDTERVVDVGLRGASDRELILWAKSQKRVIVSRDTDFLE